MASTYSNIKIQLMATGENTTTWGDVTNVNLGTALEEAIVGSADVAFSNANVTLTLTNTNSTQSARNMRLNLTGTATSGYNLVLGSGCQIDKPYIINNGTDGTITVKNTTGNGIAVPAGKTMWVFNNGTDVVDAITHVTSLTTTGNATIGGTLSTGGNLTIGGGGDLLISSATGGNNTAIYNDAQDFYVQVNSATRMYISPTGLTGIGATAPKTRLQVTAGGFLNAPVLGSATGAPFYVTNSDSSYGLIVGINSADGRAFLQSQRTDGTATSGNITLNEAGGAVGIGLASPTRKLDVAGGGRFLQDTAATTGAIVLRQNSGDTVGGFIQWVNNANLSEKGWLVIDTSSNMIFGPNSAEAMRITSAGNVGIGTSSPGNKLSVNGEASFGASIFTGTGVSTGDCKLELGANRSDVGAAYLDLHAQAGQDYNARVLRASGANGSFELLNAGTGAMTFSTNNTERMRIDSSGNVGIGTNSPTEKLNVVGNILATGNITAYSDVRLKTDLTRIEGALDKIEKLAGYTYTRTDSGERQTGLLAQDVQAVLPEAVVEGEYLSVAYGNLAGLFVEAINELRAEVKALKK